MSYQDTGHLLSELILVLEKPYVITTNIEVADGFANGEVGALTFIGRNNEEEVTNVWLKFRDKIGRKKILQCARKA